MSREDGKSWSKNKPCDMKWSKARAWCDIGLGEELGDVGEEGAEKEHEEWKN